MIERDLSHSVKIAGVTICIGMTCSPDHRTFYYIDSPTFQIIAHNYHIDRGDIANGKVAINIPEQQGFPDGMNIYMEGVL